MLSTAPKQPSLRPPVPKSDQDELDRLRVAIRELRAAVEALPALRWERERQRHFGAAAGPAMHRPGASAKTRPPVAIDVRGLTKRFGPRVAVDGLSFQVPQGSITGFVGPNGSGKTTTIRMLLHLAKADAGQATVLGHPIDEPSAYLGRVGALIEGPAFDPGLSGAKNLKVHALLGKHPTSRIPALLEQAGLTTAGPKPFKAYSLGMKQRLGIAAALLGDPQLLILDEPTNGLDPAGIRDVRAMFGRLRDAGKTLFVSSHLLSEVERMCDHVVVINDGRLVYEGPVKGLAGRHATMEERILELTERHA